MRVEMLATLVGLALCASMAAAPNDGMVGYWDFDEGKGNVLHDRSGNANHGRIHGAQWVQVGKGYALKFDGVDNYVDCGDGASLDITGPITLQAWVRPTRASEGEPGIVGKFFESYAMTYYTNAYFYLSSGGNNVRCPLPVRKWSHIAGTFDGTTLRMSLNGEEVITETSKFKTVKHGNSFLMGCIIEDQISMDSPRRNTAFFPGLIDDVRVHNRALRREEIVQCYNLEAESKMQQPIDIGRFGHFLLEPSRVIVRDTIHNESKDAVGSSSATTSTSTPSKTPKSST